MIGILVALIISWILLYLVERKNILSLGFLPISKRLKQLAIGFSITAILCIGVESLEMLLRSSSLHLNKNSSADLILNMFWWDFKSVLTEELFFRGALLFILIERIGARKGIIISAVAFGIYHWFSFRIFGNILYPTVLGWGLNSKKEKLIFVVARQQKQLFQWTKIR